MRLDPQAVYGVKIDRIKCDVIIRRLKTVYGLTAILAATGEDFERVSVKRGLIAAA